ncbi:hypothetical protein R5R35_002521 [Gryllus longicercus]|uniref:Nephrin n=1 Tax=Gryllus longicercus TaxID=2509291 RepID=A0AAN9VT07_9ORTH
MKTDDVFSVCWMRLRQLFTRRNEALAAPQWVGVGPGNKNVGLPPQNLTLLNEEGREIEGAALGPFAEGASTVVRCVAEGGRPLPQVSWWRDGAPLAAEEDALQAQQQAFAQSTLRVGPLARADLGSELQCRAANSDLVPPLRRSLAIDLLLPALGVRLVGPNRPLSARITQDVQCQAVGARPSPRLSWRLAGVPLHGARQTSSADGNVTTSTLPLAPTAQDLGRELECAVGGGSTLRDAWRLDVRYVPEVSLDLGANLNASFIREGDDVYFECSVRAHPWIHKVVWKHQGRPLHSNASAGVILSNQTLVLQSVRNHSSGDYTCVASNAEGDGESEPFRLDVKYAPVCRPHQQRVYGAARLETLQVSCEVDANPPAALFRWSFNSSAVAPREVTAVASAAGGGRSLAAYTPRAERDYGTLLCWGRNALGAQAQPCVFHVVPAGRPEAPRGCALRNRTWSALQVACARGFDGGLPQRFTLEVFAGRRLVANVTARSAPEFTVAGLEPGAAYVLQLYASNGKGRSEDTVSLRASTLRAGAQEPRRTAAAAPSGDGGVAGALLPGAPLLWALVGAGAALALAGVAAAAAAALRGGGGGGGGCCACCACCRCCAADEDDAQSGDASPHAQRELKSPGPKHLGLKGSAAAVGGVAGAEAAAVAAAAAAAGVEGGTLLAPGPTTLLADDPLDNPDVVPFANEMDLPRALLKALDPSGAGAGGRALALDSPSQAPLYVSLHSYSRAPTAENLGSLAPSPVTRWPPPPPLAAPQLRDMGTQAQAPSALLGAQTPLAQASPAQTPTAPPARPGQGLPPGTRHHAETQTPLPHPPPHPLRHKESAV